MSEALQLPRTVVPTATMRRQVTVPLRFADGYATTAKQYPVIYLLHGRGDSMRTSAGPGPTRMFPETTGPGA